MQKPIKKHNLRLINEVYALLGCSKGNISRWRHNPCSTQAGCKNAKLTVITNAVAIFELNKDDSGILANKAGLSLSNRKNGLSDIIKCYTGKYCDLLKNASVSERMFQYYLAGKEPTKQALLAISISLELSLDEIQSLLGKYGYYLSGSLPDDSVVLWFLKNTKADNNISQLYSINEVLENLELPLLMTRLYERLQKDKSSKE